LCGLTYPLWGVLSFVCLMAWSDNANVPPAQVVTALITCLTGFVGGCTLLRRYLTSDGVYLDFPGLRRRKFKLQTLTFLCLTKGRLEFCFSTAESKEQMLVPAGPMPWRQQAEETVRLAVNRLSQQDRILLLEFLSEHAPNCVISEEDRRLVEAGDQLTGFDPAKPVRIPYDSHSKLKAFYEVCLNYERLFWCVFLGCCSPLAVFLLPFAIILPYFFCLRLAGVHTSFMNSFTPWLYAWEPLTKYGLGPAADSVGRYQQFISSHFWVACLLLVLAVLVILQLLRLLARPTAVVLSPVGLQLKTGNLGLRFDLRKFAWKDLKSVELQKGAGSLNSDQLAFFGKKGSPLAVLDLKALSRRGCRQLLKKAIEEWAPGVEIDAGFIESAAVRRQSYTELWLSSLNTPPKRDRLAPLRKGDCLKAGAVRILDTLGAGGQGVAYLAEYMNPSCDLSEEVVVKEFILPVYVDRRARLQALERFQHESRVLSSLDHEHIVRLKEHFIEDHRAYLILERIKGQSLRRLASGRGTADEALLERLTRQMCEMLSYLHCQSPPVVHRDFTPDNLILDESGVLKLIDFNVAYQSGLQAKTSVVGKHAYMPPEQFAGRPRVESDIYALGATLYYLLAGSDPEPFCQYGTPADCLELSLVWHEILMGCTDVDPAGRFHSCADIIALLDKTFSAGPQTAPDDGEEEAGVISTAEDCCQPVPVPGEEVWEEEPEASAQETEP
jgi:tRNA A-37 threonylcarbamoyl transferase component Bud32